MERFLNIINLFPMELRSALSECIRHMAVKPEEIRMQVGSPIRLRAYGTEVLCGTSVTKEQMVYVVGNGADGSFHTAVHSLQNGFLPLKDGCRMGVCGVGVNGRLSSLWDISSVCIRVASEAIGCSDELYKVLYGNGYCNTIIIAPPGVGKTTLLRELIRRLSYSGMHVGVADERGEIAGMYLGRASFDLGPRCDVITAVKKSQAAMMLLRSMAPDVIAMDEITAYSDSEALLEVTGCGVGLLSTMHGDELSFLDKPTFKQINDATVFRKAVLIDVVNGERRYKVVEL